MTDRPQPDEGTLLAFVATVAIASTLGCVALWWLGVFGG